MNDWYKGAAQALIKNLWLIIIVTVLAGVLALGKELLFPVPYTADTMLLVTGVERGSAEEGSSTTKMMPPPLNPKAYEMMLESSSVLGRVLDRLKKEGAYGKDTPPELLIFRGNLSVTVDIVDETSRPVSYSPLLRMTARAETAELAKKIVDVWAEVATTQAQQAAAMRVGPSASMLVGAKKKYESELQTAWEEMRKETGTWNLDVLKADLDANEVRMNTLMDNRANVDREHEAAKRKLEVLNGDFSKLLKDSQNKYSGESVELREKMKAEMSLANVEMLSTEMEQRLEMQVKLADDQGRIERQLKGDEESLVTIRKSLETEKPMLELGQAPSTDAYWIVGGANTKSLADLKEKVMVTQEMNPTYLELKKNENARLSDISQKKAELESIRAQADALNEQLVSLKAQYGQHKMTQGGIANDLNVSEKTYGLLGSEEEMSVFAVTRTTMLEVESSEAELTAIDRQMETLKKEQDELKQQIAEHTMAQMRLKSRTEIAKKIFDDVASEESLMSAANAIAKGEPGMDKPVGLNRITTETYATEDKGLVGRKGRVLLTTMLAFLLTCGLAYVKDDGMPRLHKWLVNLN